MELTGSEQVLSVSEIIRHSRYVADSTIGFPNDIALLRLAAPANLDDPNVAVVCIPENSTHLFDGRPNCWMTGWGLVDFWDGRLPTVLQEGEQELLTNEECQAEFPFPNLRETHQCVGRGADGTPGACQGDSGGPLTCLEDNGKWYQVGVTSFGILGCEGAPSMYTRVAAYREWIIDRINAP
ncbi:unnamed protein product [Owenia fusiformis]|nr:unnamed protein product [Owenia fusiformis]